MFDQSKSALTKFLGERISMTTGVKQECEDITRGGYGRGRSKAWFPLVLRIGDSYDFPILGFLRLL